MTKARRKQFNASVDAIKIPKQGSKARQAEREGFKRRWGCYPEEL